MKKAYMLAFGFLMPMFAEAKQPTTVSMQNSNMVFIENKGQVTDQYYNPRSDIQFKMETPGVNVFIGNGQIHYQWNTPVAAPALQKETLLQQLRSANPAINTYRMDITLLGANTNAQVITEDRQRYQEISYVGTGVDGITANSYRKITYKNVYPDIDWVFYVNDDQHVEYDFVVRPGGNVSDIQLKYDGATALSMNDGSLTATTPSGTVTEHAPYSYTEEDGAKIASNFVLKNNILSFKAANYSGTLIIDPSLLWATYYGGDFWDLPFSVITDAAGYIYMEGAAGSTNNIATVGSYQAVLNGGFDGFLVKFNSAGVRQFGTYYGGTGTGNDWFYGMAIDTSANIYAGGYTNSKAGISTPTSQQPIYGGNSDAMLVKFDSGGHRVWATYYGGTGDDEVGYCAIDNNTGTLYLDGYTSSTTNMSTFGSFQPTNAGGYDAFLAKFDLDGNRIWGTFYGGAQTEYGGGIALGLNGDVYIGGTTASPTGIGTAGTFQPTYADSTDFYVAKFNSAGVRIWGTYYGGIHNEGKNSTNTMTSDKLGNVYITGITSSPAGIASAGSYQPVYANGGDDAFFAKLDTAGHRIWGTYYGGPATENTGTPVVEPSGNILFSGITTSTTGIATPGSHQPVYAGSTDGFLARFDTAGNRLMGTYFGAAGYEEADAVAVDNEGNILLLGSTSSTSGIATPGSAQPTYGGALVTNGFLAKFCGSALLPNDTIRGSDSVCTFGTETYSIPAVTSATAYIWILPSGWHGTSDSSSITVTTGATGGTISVQVVRCGDTSNTQMKEVYVRPSVPPVITTDGFVLGTVGTYASYQWCLNNNPIPNATHVTYTVMANGNYTVITTNEYGCIDTSDVYTVNNYTGIESAQALAQQIKIYPNPAADLVYIRAMVPVNVTLVSVEGKIIRETQHAQTISIQNLSDGIYFLRITNKNGHLIKVAKILKQ